MSSRRDDLKTPDRAPHMTERPHGQSWLPSRGLRAHSEAILSQSTVFTTPANLEEGEERYQRISLLGQGGMGRVWMGWDNTLQRNVAIKEPLGGQDSPQSRQLTYEAMITARLEHPAIVSIHDVFQDKGRPNFVMRLVCGQTMGQLAQVHHRDAQDELPAALIRHVLSVCEAIGYAHDSGVLHRDISPMNVLIGDDGSVHIIDWGLAAHLDDVADRLGYVGTPGYVSPEQRMGQGVDTRSDVWSLGALLHSVVYGVAPDDAGTSLVVRDARLHAIMMCALSLHPEERYASGFAMAYALQRWFEGHRVHAYDATPWMELRRMCVLYRKGIGAGLIVVIAFVALASWGAWRTRAEAHRARHAESMALSREQDTQRQAEQARRVTSTLLHERAKERAVLDDVFVAEHLAVQSLQMSDNPDARGLLSVLAARMKPVATLLAHLPECPRAWKLSGVHGVALCAGIDTSINTSWVGAWGNGEWLWASSLDHVHDLGCGIARVKSVGDKVLVDVHPHGQCQRGFWVQDVRSGDVIRQDATKGLLVSGDNMLRVSEEASVILGYPETRNICEGRIMHVAQAPDEAIWFVCSDHKVFTLDAQREITPVAVSEKDGVRWVAFDLKGLPWVTTQKGKLFAMDESQVSWDFDGPLKRVFMLPDSPLLVLLSEEGVVSVFNTQSREWEVRLPELYVDALPGEEHSLNVIQHNRDMVSWTFPKKLGRYRNVAGISSLDWSGDGKYVAALDGHGHVNMFAPETGERWQLKHWSKGVGKWIAAAHTFNGFMMIGVFSRGVHTLTLEQDRLRASRVDGISPETVASRVMLSPDDDVVAALYGWRARLKYTHESASRDVSLSFEQHMRDMDSPPSGRFVATVSAQNVTLWDWEVLPPKLLMTHRGEVHMASVNERGEVLVGEREAIGLIDESGELARRWRVPGSPLLDVEWVPHKSWAVSAHKNGSVKVWDVSSGELLAQSTQHTARAARVAISPDGRWLASGGWDGQIVLWDLTVLGRSSHVEGLHALSQERAQALMPSL